MSDHKAGGTHSRFGTWLAGSILSTPWMLLSLLTVFLWGAWGLESKMIVDHISPWMNQILFSVGLIPLILVVLFSKNLRGPGDRMKVGASYGIITGILGGTGNMALYLALGTGGKASVVVPFVGLAPLITIILALAVLKESINRTQMVGLAMALVSILLLSI